MKFENVSMKARQAMRQVRIGYRLAIIFSVRAASYIFVLYVLVIVFGADTIHRFVHNAEMGLRDQEGISLFTIIISVAFFILRTAVVEMMEKEIQEIEEKK
jgi:ABC-type iron transport system FetAB permease component